MTSLPTKTVGIYRRHGVLGLPTDARIRNFSGEEIDIPEQRYRNGGHEPPFEELPWKEVYEVHSNAETDDG